MTASQEFMAIYFFTVCDDSSWCSPLSKCSPTPVK